MTTHSRILAWRIPWTEEPGGLQSMGSQRAGHAVATEHMAQSSRIVSSDYFRWLFPSLISSSHACADRSSVEDLREAHYRSLNSPSGQLSPR